MKKLGFGLMRLPQTDPDDAASVDVARTAEMVDHFLEQGFTYFDTAYPYHNGASETAARAALVERYPRDAFQLADKMPVWMVKEAADYQRIFDEQLARCGVAFFDYYLLHSLDEESYNQTDALGGFAFLVSLKERGLAKKIGFSFHDKADVLDRILTEHPEVEFVQLQINYIDWDDESVQSRLCYETATRHGKPVIVMEPVKGGSLAVVPDPVEALFRELRPDWSPAAWALRFAAALDNVPVVLSGMSDLEQMRDNAAVLADAGPLRAEEAAAVRQAVDQINTSIAIACTACQYCVADCPKNIPIPRYFSLYNNLRRFSQNAAQLDYDFYVKSFGRAGDCIACGQCERHCPQHLPIVEHLRSVAAAFDTAPV